MSIICNPQDDNPRRYHQSNIHRECSKKEIGYYSEDKISDSLEGYYKIPEDEFELPYGTIETMKLILSPLESLKWLKKLLGYYKNPDKFQRKLKSMDFEDSEINELMREKNGSYVHLKDFTNFYQSRYPILYCFLVETNDDVRLFKVGYSNNIITRMKGINCEVQACERMIPIFLMEVKRPVGGIIDKSIHNKLKNKNIPVDTRTSIKREYYPATPEMYDTILNLFENECKLDNMENHKSYIFENPFVSLSNNNIFTVIVPPLDIKYKVKNFNIKGFEKDMEDPFGNNESWRMLIHGDPLKYAKEFCK